MEPEKSELTGALRPQRWDEPFSAEMDDEHVEHILSVEPFCAMDPTKFPDSLSLEGILKNDSRLRKYDSGDIVVRAGDYGSSAFIVLSGTVRVVTGEGLTEEVLGRQEEPKKSLYSALRQLWTNSSYPEVRTAVRATSKDSIGQRGTQDETRIFLQDVPAIIEEYSTVILSEGEMFGEIAALSRSVRTATIFSEGNSELLEIRWQGLRDIRRRAEEFRKRVDALYRRNRLSTHLRSTSLFQHLEEDVIAQIAEATLFESYGDFDWYTTYKKQKDSPIGKKIIGEPLIVSEGDYPDGLLLISSGFGRVSRAVNHGHKTLGYIGKGEIFGFQEIYENWKQLETTSVRNSLRAIGYTDILRVPTNVIEELVLPSLPEEKLARLISSETRVVTSNDKVQSEGIEQGAMEFLVEHRYVNGTATMLIDLDRCVRCDECVRACSVGHNNNPRFNRHGKRYDHYMVANACMHCVDPVCMIGCPTGAIHRSSEDGQVVINDKTCIGCATCADSCPYDNIRMVGARDRDGAFIVDQQTFQPIVKATKCDLCIDQLGGPACERACPHDALKRTDMSDLPSLGDWLDR
jgi:Fe-S-cluster-containing dehydrogenase component/CRP-like cAMP-binding protein